MKQAMRLGMRLLCVLLCAVCLVSLARPAAAREAALAADQTLTTVVRMSAKAGSTIIGQLENGTAVTVLSSKGDFYMIDCYDMNGYVAKSQILHTEEEEYYVSCQPGAAETRVLTYTDPAQAIQTRHSLLVLAKKQLGSRYVYGAARPGAFDCSGLTSYLYSKHGIPLHRRASLQLQDGVIVPKEAMQVGDLVFFRQGTAYPASHVGIYAGNNKIIHAGSNSGVVYSDLSEEYYARYFLCARRVINTQGACLEQQPQQRSITEGLNFTSVTGRTAR